MVAAIPAVRQALLAFQRDFAHHPPGGATGAVLDGRDIGTVVCPEADAKLFVTASIEARAARRFKELQDGGSGAIYERVLQDMKDRDARDSERASGAAEAGRRRASSSIRPRSMPMPPLPQRSTFIARKLASAGLG